MHIKLKRSPGIYLAGFMGAGKSTVGRVLADRIGWDFADLDADIETNEKDTVAHIFELRGESEFRRLEKDMIAARVRRIERGAPTVVALGGGAFVSAENFELIRNHGISIWLQCSFEQVQQRLNATANDRPLARDPEKFRQLFDARQEAYGRADFHVDGNCDTDRTVAAILALPIWK